MGGDVFTQAFVYLLAAVVAVPVAKRMGLGSVLGYLIAGVAIGPFVLGFVGGGEGEGVLHVAEFGVVMMLFLVGLELQPSRLWRMRVPILGLGGLQVVGTALVVGAAALLVGGQRLGPAVAIGLILALSSTAIVLQTFTEKGLMRTEAGQNGFSILLFQDIAVIPMLALLPLLAVAAPAAGGGDDGPIQDLPGWGQALAVLAAVAAVVLAGRFLVRPALRFVAASGIREMFTAAALLLVIGIALLMSVVGLSPALGTFLAGVVLADSEYRHELESDIEPFKGLLLGLFFIAVGASVELDVIGDAPLTVAGIVGGLVVAKAAVLWLLGLRFGMGVDQRIILSLALAQGGEFAFVLFSVAEQGGVLTREVTALLVGSVAVSMAVTPLLLVAADSLLLPRVGTLPSDPRPHDAVDEHNPVIVAGFGGFGSSVGRLLRANGVGVTVLDSDPDHVEVLRRLGMRVFYGDASRPDLLRAAGAEHARVLVVALRDPDEVVALTHAVQRHFPRLEIVARAANRSAATRLLNGGVERVHRDTLDSALRAGTDVMSLLGTPRFQAVRAAQAFRHHDERHLRRLAAVAHDRVRYISEARESIRLIEETMLAEVAEGPERDSGWDNTSLRRDTAERGTPTAEDGADGETDRPAPPLPEDPSPTVA